MKNNTAYFFVFMFWVFSVNAQSKKEQIESLNYQIDSLNQVLLKEQKLNTNSTFEISQLNAELTRLNASISSLNAEVSKLTSSLKSNQEELSKLQAQLKVKSDSLLLVQKELNALKLPPIQINNTPAVVSLQKGPYKTVQIGTQVWMTKNLDVYTFRNGDQIPEAKSNEEWEKAGENKQPAWCYYNNDPANGAKYGKLYNWYAVNDPRGLAPEGWHVPSYDEWTALNKQLGDDVTIMKSTSGWERRDAPIKCSNCKNWNSEYRRKTACHVCQDNRTTGKGTDYNNGTNSSGFSAVPGGWCNQAGTFYEIREKTMWWCSGYEAQSFSVWFWIETPFYSFPVRGSGLSVRCIKD